MVTRVVPILILLFCMIYTAVHVVQSDSEHIRGLPKWLWLILVLVVPGLGLVAYWIFGRPIDHHNPPPTAPDDDPGFLRSL